MKRIRKIMILLFLSVCLLAGMKTVKAEAGMDKEAGAQTADGRYEIEVSLQGGSGRAYVESPMEIDISDGSMTAVVVWSSPNYDQMLVNGTYFYPVNEDGNSVFEIPLISLEEDLSFSAETLAMSEPHEIDYLLQMDSSTLVPMKDGQADRSLWMAGAVLVLAVGVFLLLMAVKRRKA